VRYLVDECLGQLVVTNLRQRGHDVEWVRDVARGMPDELVLEWSVREERVLLTEDYDYGDLIFAKGRPAFAVVILQLSGFPGTWEDVAAGVVERLANSQHGFPGYLTILGQTRIKARVLPTR
jgi:predicted nuclease of predicted toxin-antitoxin system